MHILAQGTALCDGFYNAAKAESLAQFPTVTRLLSPRLCKTFSLGFYFNLCTQGDPLG